jgi:hypothetical protein
MLFRIGWIQLSLKELLRQTITAVEREVFIQVLRQTGRNKAKAAQLLQVDYKTIHEKVIKLGIWIDERFSNESAKEVIYEKESLSGNGFMGSADIHHFGLGLCSDLRRRGGRWQFFVNRDGNRDGSYQHI